MIGLILIVAYTSYNKLQYMSSQPHTKMIFLLLLLLCCTFPAVGSQTLVEVYSFIVCSHRWKLWGKHFRNAGKFSWTTPHDTHDSTSIRQLVPPSKHSEFPGVSEVWTLSSEESALNTVGSEFSLWVSCGSKATRVLRDIIIVTYLHSF